MASQVQVQDVGELRSYGMQLSALREDMITSATHLSQLAEEIAETASSMQSATDGQGSNWSDPQYDNLKSEITPVISSVGTTAESMRETASLINSKMESVEESIEYIAALVAKLEDI